MYATVAPTWCRLYSSWFAMRWLMQFRSIRKKWLWICKLDSSCSGQETPSFSNRSLRLILLPDIKIWARHRARVWPHRAWTVSTDLVAEAVKETWTIVASPSVVLTTCKHDSQLLLSALVPVDRHQMSNPITAIPFHQSLINWKETRKMLHTSKDAWIRIKFSQQSLIW